MEVSELDGEDTLRLQELLHRPTRVLRLLDPGSDPVAVARNSHAPEVLILDRAHGRVSLVRQGESEVWVRSTEPDALSRSSYAVSFVAAELLTLSAQLAAERARRFSLDHLWLRAGADVRWGGAPYQGVVRPAFGLGFVWSRPERALGLAVEFAGALAGGHDKRTEFGQIELTRHDLEARCGLRYRHGKLALLGLGQLGLGMQHAEYTGPGGVSRRYLSSNVGAGIQLQVSALARSRARGRASTPGLSLFAEVFSGLNTGRVDFAIQGESAAREGPWFGRAGIGLALVLPVR